MAITIINYVGYVRRGCGRNFGRSILEASSDDKEATTQVTPLKATGANIIDHKSTFHNTEDCGVLNEDVPDAVTPTKLSYLYFHSRCVFQLSRRVTGCIIAQGSDYQIRD